MVNTVANTKPLVNAAPKAVELNGSVPKSSKELDEAKAKATGEESFEVMGIPQITTLKEFLEVHIC